MNDVYHHRNLVGSGLLARGAADLMLRRLLAQPLFEFYFAKYRVGIKRFKILNRAAAFLGEDGNGSL